MVSKLRCSEHSDMAANVVDFGTKRVNVYLMQSITFEMWKEIFNLDAKSFDCGTLADATLSHVKQLCIGFMHSNYQVTVVLAVFLKDSALYYQKICQQATVIYTHSLKAWMPDTSFNISVKQLDDHLRRKGRKILLFEYGSSSYFWPGDSFKVYLLQLWHQIVISALHHQRP